MASQLSRTMLLHSAALRSGSSSSKILAQAFAASSNSRFMSSTGRPAQVDNASNALPGSAAKQGSPGSLVGGRVGVIAPSQALTEDWAIQHEHPDYSRGPSALDKASRLFFFTEILRGMWVV